VADYPVGTPTLANVVPAQTILSTFINSIKNNLLAVIADLFGNVHGLYLASTGFALASTGDVADISVIADFDSSERRVFTRFENTSGAAKEPHITVQFDLSANAVSPAGKTLTFRHRLAVTTSEQLSLSVVPSTGSEVVIGTVTTFTDGVWQTSTFTMPAGTYTQGGRFQLRFVMEALEAANTFDLAEVKIA